MSQVFSFRLDENNPREAQAMQIIEAWASRGYSLRHTLVEALLAYAGKDLQKDGVSSTLEEIITMLQNLHVVSGLPRNEQSQDKRLSDEFLNAIAKATRPGLQAE
jgi:hypothetical protein